MKSYCRETHLLSNSYLWLLEFLAGRKQGQDIMKYKDVLGDISNGAVHPDISRPILCA